MRKIILLFFIFIISVYQVKSQVLITLIFGDKLNSDKLEFGLEGGGNFSKISGFESTKFLKDWNLGFYFDVNIKEGKPWNFYTGVLVKSKMGLGDLTVNDVLNLKADTLSTPGTYSQKINYFMVPFLIKYKFNPHIYLEAGPQFSLMYKAFVEYDADVDGKTAVIRDFNSELFRRVDAGIMIGTGYRFRGRTGWTVGVKYYYGFTDVLKDVSGTKSQSVYLKLNIPIGRSEKAQQKRTEGAAKKAARKAK